MNEEPKGLNNVIEFKLWINDWMRTLFILSFIYELRLYIPILNEVLSSAPLLNWFINVGYAIMCYILIFSSQRAIGFIFVILYIIKMYTPLRNTTIFLNIDSIVSLANLTYVFISTKFFTKIKYYIFGAYL